MGVVAGFFFFLSFFFLSFLFLSFFLFFLCGCWILNLNLNFELLLAFRVCLLASFPMNCLVKLLLLLGQIFISFIQYCNPGGMR
ncbi:hypothetical protein HOY80DRAFT_954294 [Tuber brumale]|nr:hypothetical protein HOY80DRAFT_954294 [Tuber brumale]